MYNRSCITGFQSGRGIHFLHEVQRHDFRIALDICFISSPYGKVGPCHGKKIYYNVKTGTGCLNGSLNL